MGNTGTNNGWERVRQGVKDTERLIGQKDYNSAMMKSRQTLEFMVKLLTERAGMGDGGDLKDRIDLLYQNRWISKSTCEHYHKIRIIGNRAAHEGDSNAYNANQAYHMLSQEVYTFANNYRNAQRGIHHRNRNTSNQTSRRQKLPSHRKKSFFLSNLLKLLIPVLFIVLLLYIINLVRPSHHNQETTAPPSIDMPTTKSPNTDTADIEPTVVYRTTSILNIRSQPNTDSERIGQLQPGTTVEYIGSYDGNWAIIMYQGKEAYVASQYLITD